MLDGTDWDENKWNWTQSLLNLRKTISYKDDDLFESNKTMSNVIEHGEKKKLTAEELQKVKEQLKPFMLDVVRELGGSTNATLLETDIDNLVEFEDKLANVILSNDSFYLIK